MIYYVNGETGLDTNDGLTSENAFKTINYAKNLWNKIDNLIVYIAGDKANSIQQIYDEYLHFTDDVLSAVVLKIDLDNGILNYYINGITIRFIGIGVNKPKISNISSPTNYSTIYLQNTFGYSFENLEIDCPHPNIYTINTHNARSFLFKDCYIKTLDYRIIYSFNYSGDYLFYNCIFDISENGVLGRFYINRGRECFLYNCDVSNEIDNIIIEFISFEGLRLINNKFGVSRLISGAYYNFIEYHQKVFTNTLRLSDSLTGFGFKFCIFDDCDIVYSSNGSQYYYEYMNTILYNIESLNLIGSMIFKNCVIWNDITDDITYNKIGTYKTNVIFRNCIIKNIPDSFPDEIIYDNCLIGVNPLLDSEFKPQYNSPCLPQNWTGENPIDTFIGRYDFYEEPSISNLIVSGDKDKIDISFTAVGSDIANTILKFSFDNETWFDMTLLDENKFVKSSYLGTVNTFTWKSKQDFLSDEIVFIEVQIHDDKNYSNILSTSTMVYNEPILLIEPDIMDITTNGTKGDIEISLNVFDEYSIVSGMLQYYDNSIWNNCTLKYGNGYFSASEIGEENTVLWDSYLDFQDDLTTKVRCSVTDKDGLTSGWVESPTFTIKNLYIEPIISSINTIGTAQDIKITYIVEDDDTEIIESEFQYLNGSDWFSCTIDYNIGLASKSSPEGVFNTVLWKSEIDVQEDITTKIRIRVFDSEWSSWYESGDILIQNGNIPPDMLYYSPLKFKLEDDKKLYFKLKKE